MNIDERINYLRKQLGIIEENKLIAEYKKIIDDKSVSNKIKSKAYFAIGEIIEVIEVIAPHISEDKGYSYFKKAIEYDEGNIEASIGICRIFNKYTAPFNSLVTESSRLGYVLYDGTRPFPEGGNTYGYIICFISNKRDFYSIRRNFLGY